MLPLETRNHFLETVEGGRQAHVPHPLFDAPKPGPLRSNLKHALMEGVEGQGLVEVKHATYNICAVTHVPLFVSWQYAQPEVTLHHAEVSHVRGASPGGGGEGEGGGGDTDGGAL